MLPMPQPALGTFLQMPRPPTPAVPGAGGNTPEGLEGLLRPLACPGRLLLPETAR